MLDLLVPAHQRISWYLLLVILSFHIRYIAQTLQLLHCIMLTATAIYVLYNSVFNSYSIDAGLVAVVAMIMYYRRLQFNLRTSNKMKTDVGYNIINSIRVRLTLLPLVLMLLLHSPLVLLTSTSHLWHYFYTILAAALVLQWYPHHCVAAFIHLWKDLLEQQRIYCCWCW